ncbi:hypothetical protein M2451_003790 [Dysgonomonas sp. PFB1-18]|uniref:DUF4099 domain-containing protein n=1 Tax=unclassified Dysgonomonas TaxID=2630389 RepID=UPI002473D649|nr:MULTISPECIES: DUF4099 domain-containing protein [unclassified Dysgonomonas]MDH6310926.1 hypothetical protein [Dysgonomonas sp. PF1-14]MDH6340859.1 hypothetical protein [Dysgonomonas sp. PF1-16]MDH6382449.1 hypothetical protein [Dysgonomonas sp. PFB1-18]MDH6399798.1 hypothetical protein [Dysgonomonas sp. PF1-23]
MNNNNNKPSLYKETDVKWDELAAINIFKDELEKSGNLEKLLNGKKTDVINIHLMLLGVDVDLYATLQIIQQGETPIVEIVGITPDYNSSN